MMPTFSLILTIHDRSPEVSKQVAESFGLPGNHPDEIVVVLDRPTPEAREGAEVYRDAAGTVAFVEIAGAPGWLCPARAWNMGFKAATSDFIYCISSETTQAEGNLARAQEIVGNGGVVLHGKAECSCGPQAPPEVNWGGTAPGNLFGDAAHPRPLGFIWAGPLEPVRKIGGFDEEFMKGYWYDDNDFFLRLWNTGLDFVFDDSVAGVHLHHERPGLQTPEGQAGIQRNAAHMLAKHGVLHPWTNLPRISGYVPGRTAWRHL